MPIKYGELTIIYNKEQTNVITNLLTWLQYEPQPPKQSKYVILFDDGEIYDVDNTITDCKFHFQYGSYTHFPIWIERKNENPSSYNKLYFYKKPIQKDNNIRLLDSSALFYSCSKYHDSNRVPSCYNCIYYCIDCAYGYDSKVEVFGMIRIKSNDYMPRFLFAYDSEHFTKDDMIYLLHNMFNPSQIAPE